MTAVYRADGNGKACRITGFASSVDGRIVWATTEQKKILIFHEFASGLRLAAQVSLAAYPLCIARDTHAADSTAVYIGCSDGKLIVSDIQASSATGEIDEIALQQVALPGPVVALLVAESHVLASCNSTGEMKIIEKMPGTGLLGVDIQTWRAHSGRVKSILRVDSSTIWTCADDRFIKVWRLLAQGSTARVIRQTDLPQQLQKISRMIALDGCIVSASDILTIWNAVRLINLHLCHFSSQLV